MFIGLFVFLLYLYPFAGFNQIYLVLKQLNSAQFALFYSLAIGAFLLTMFFWTMSWRTFLSYLSIRIGIKDAFLFYWVGYFVDLVIPCESDQRTRVSARKAEKEYTSEVTLKLGIKPEKG
jgi:uncharacterized membrane protein YbhN (UPF0104 family)